MDTPLKLGQDYREFIELLNANAVEYLIVGGWAVTWLARPRFTGDIDVWIRTTEENKQRMVQTLNDFGFASLKVKASDFDNQENIIQLGFDPVRIDILVSIDGVTFEEAYSNRIIWDEDGLPVSVINLPELIANKLASGRPKDLGDVDTLRRVKKPTPAPASRSPQKRR